jgi:hypothetical protein
MRNQFNGAAIARDGDDGPDPAARQGKPLPRPACGGAGRHWIHSPIFPAAGHAVSVACWISGSYPAVSTMALADPAHCLQATGCGTREAAGPATLTA